MTNNEHMDNEHWQAGRSSDYRQGKSQDIIVRGQNYLTMNVYFFSSCITLKLDTKDFVSIVIF